VYICTNIVIFKETNEQKHNMQDYVIHFVIFKETITAKSQQDGDSYVITLVKIIFKENKSKI